MGASSSKTPEEIYLHTVKASAALFKSIAKHAKNGANSSTDNEAKLFNNFFAEYRQCFELGELVLNHEIHVKHVGIQDAQMDFPEYLIKKKVPLIPSFSTPSSPASPSKSSIAA